MTRLEELELQIEEYQFLLDQDLSEEELKEVLSKLDETATLIEDELVNNLLKIK